MICIGSYTFDFARLGVTCRSIQVADSSTAREAEFESRLVLSPNRYPPPTSLLSIVLAEGGYLGIKWAVSLGRGKNASRTGTTYPRLCFLHIHLCTELLRGPLPSVTLPESKRTKKAGAGRENLPLGQVDHLADG